MLKRDWPHCRLHERSPVGSSEDDVLERETMIVGSEEARGKGCALRVLFGQILLRDSACSPFRHVRATTFAR